ncbi:putative flavin monooxygenase, FAD/NAD(P)-binding domain superfamily [Septoria linicola]|nr:putative flavin monooxygenase, FAD/NAD(P)-binding domain superfamily [Septoria linicola]
MRDMTETLLTFDLSLSGIVGAGPSGLASAKVLLQTSQFEVTIYEQSDQVGGIWSTTRDSWQDGFLHPETPTNLSRFTVAFSDLDWHSVGLDKVPMFPKAWQVNQYLEAYRRKYIPDNVFHFDHKVISIQKSGRSWRVTTCTEQGAEEIRDFDYLLLGSGFFSGPRSLPNDVQSMSTESHLKIIHSSQFRSLDDLFDNAENATGKTILLIGGGNSAGEATAAVAQQLSDAWYSPATGRSRPYKDCKIVHVTPRPLYALPPYNPIDKGNATYVPLDWKLYDLSRRPAGPIVGNAGQLSQAAKDMIHNALQAQIGGDQSDLLSSALAIPSQEPRSAVYVALSESYPEFVRSGLIEVHSGRVVMLQSAGKETCTATVEGTAGTETLTNIGAIIYATGYTPATAIEFLPDDVKQALHHDPSSDRLPLMLSGWQTMSPHIPELAFIGFYEGPYWPIIEMQARYTAQRWLNQTAQSMVHPQEETEKLLALRAEMHKRSLYVPQYWFGDYLGYMEELASHLHLSRNDAPFAEREGPTSPARYLLPTDSNSQAEAIMQDLHTVWTACTIEGKFVARAAFRALQGNWNITRKIDSRLSSFPCGTLQGQASFHPRSPSPDKSQQTFDLEYLYQESGTLKLSNGASMTAHKSYVYRYSEARDELSVWFVKPNDDLQVDYLFHNLAFAPPSVTRSEGACIAKADHLCSKDMYYTEYRLPIKGIALHEFTTTHTVQGPHKDYTATTEYKRPAGKP